MKGHSSRWCRAPRGVARATGAPSPLRWRAAPRRRLALARAHRGLPRAPVLDRARRDEMRARRPKIAACQRSATSIRSKSTLPLRAKEHHGALSSRIWRLRARRRRAAIEPAPVVLFARAATWTCCGIDVGAALARGESSGGARASSSRRARSRHGCSGQASCVAGPGRRRERLASESGDGRACRSSDASRLLGTIGSNARS